MEDKIIKLREEIVSLCNDKQKAKRLLEDLTDAEIERNESEMHFFTRKRDIVDEKDFGNFSVYEFEDTCSVRFKGGYEIFVNDNIESLNEGIINMLVDIRDKKMKKEFEEYKEDMALLLLTPMYATSDVRLFVTITTMLRRYLNGLTKYAETHPNEEDAEGDEVIEMYNELFKMTDVLAKKVEQEGLEFEKKNNSKNKKTSTEEVLP